MFSVVKKLFDESYEVDTVPNIWIINKHEMKYPCESALTALKLASKAIPMETNYEIVKSTYETFEAAYDDCIRLTRNRKSKSSSEGEERGRGRRVKKKKIVTDYETSKEEEPEVVPTRKEKKNVETKELGPPPKPPQPKPSTCKGEVKSTSSVIPTPKPNSILNRRIHSKKSSAGDESIALKGSAEPSQLKQPISESAEQSSNHQLSPEISELNGDSGTFMMSDGPSDLESPRKSTSMVKQNLFKPVKLIRYKQGKKLSTRVHYDINALQRKQLCIPYAPFLAMFLHY